MVTPAQFQNDGFGTIIQELNAGETDTDEVLVALTTTNAVPQPLYQLTLSPSSTVTFRSTVIATASSAVVVGKFVREFTVKRNGSNPAVLVQDLVPSPNYQENPGLDVSPGVNTNNAVITVTGLAGTVTWHGRIEVVS
jgi:limonene-1,2-epoxide hydrolase